MYSVVLMLAVSGSVETPHWCRGCIACFGCHGCCGCFGCNGCCGCHGRWNCNGCNGCHGMSVHCNGCSGYIIVPSGQGAPEPIQQPKRKQETSASVPATLVVDLPEDARLTIDERPTDSKSPRRIFVTPALPRGVEFTYALKAEIVRAGQTVVTTRQVAVRGGQQTLVRLVFPAIEVTVTEIAPPE